MGTGSDPATVPAPREPENTGLPSGLTEGSTVIEMK